MQWADEPNGGFSAADETVTPVIDHGVWSYEHINVAEQRRDPDQEVHADEDGALRVPLDALDYRWFSVGGLNYAVKRTRG